ncbi:hypothetical protein [Simkania sp.]|uniref:hypothetical protein n=1 Tax=Simkania sp. TaxID=34094 RepID=UPI003B52E597
MAARDLKRDLEEIHNDWEQIFAPEVDLKDPAFLKKVAHDIVNLEKDSIDALKDEQLKEKAELVQFLLTTPWGAPFIGETTLLDAALSYQDGDQDSALMHLLSGFAHHGSGKQTALFNYFDEISRDIA